MLRTDGEASFFISIFRNKDYKLGWQIQPAFSITLHNKDSALLHQIQSFFGVGKIRINKNRGLLTYSVLALDDLKNVLIPHFEKYPLISNKALDFLLWSKVISLILTKDHLTELGFSTILSRYPPGNWGISKKVLSFYPDIKPFGRPVITLPLNLNPQWVSGFVAGDGGFSIYVKPAKDYLLSEKVYCRFAITQHIKDLELIKLFSKFFNCCAPRHNTCEI